MKNKKIQITILLILTLVSGYFIFNNQKGSIKKELRDFAIEDTATVDKLFLVDKQNNSILLERKQDYWTVNGNYEARQDLINIVLKTLHRLRVKEPVAKSAHDNIVKSLAVKSTKVEVYQNGKQAKTMYIGGPTMDSYGTYMILENSSRPFIMEIPGFRGYLSTRFTTLEIEWRAQSVFHIPLNNIKKVTFNNLLEPKESFSVTHANNEYGLYNSKNEAITDFNTIEVKKFLMEFRKKNFNKYIEDVPQEWQDSIKQSQPMFIISVEKADGNKQWVKAFNKPGWGKVDFFGDDLPVDPDNFFLLNDNNDFVYAQYFSFNPIFKKLSDFKKE